MKHEVATRLSRQVAEHVPRLAALPEEALDQPWAAGKWTAKEVLGHLCDSAAINLQRVVRSQYEEPYEFPYYEQATWVRVQAYASYPWPRLVERFRVEYEHLVWVLEHLADGWEETLAPVTFGSTQFVTLGWLLAHVWRHNDHHLKQVYFSAGVGELPDPEVLNAPFARLPGRS